jgi:TetR/AcrR family transcriptional repressor of bet genes
MASLAKKLPANRRTVSKEQRREQLIKATIKSVAKRGLGETTMADVTREAGLSLGIVNLHFQSKHKLLEETLRYLSEEYESACQAALAKAGSSAARKLEALVDLDFSPKVCDRGKLAVWFAYWGEVKSRPTYLQICADKDNRYEETVTNLCQELIDQGALPGSSARDIAAGLSALVNGFWLDLLITPDKTDRKTCRKICMNYLAHAFPEQLTDVQ